jgi:hypothetical protein
MNREGAETHLRVLAEAQLRRAATISTGAGQWLSARFALVAEVGKLATVRALGLSETVFADTSDRIVAAWRARAARMYHSNRAECPDPAGAAHAAGGAVLDPTGRARRLAGRAAGRADPPDNARAVRRVEKELISELTNVPAKRSIFTKMVDAAMERPDDTVREALYPVVPGSVMTLEALAKELKANERAVAERARYQLRGLSGGSEVRGRVSGGRCGRRGAPGSGWSGRCGGRPAGAECKIKTADAPARFRAVAARASCDVTRTRVTDSRGAKRS